LSNAAHKRGAKSPSDTPAHSQFASDRVGSLTAFAASLARNPVDYEARVAVTLRDHQTGFVKSYEFDMPVPQMPEPFSGPFLLVFTTPSRSF
jgi:hypothetical protein